MIICSYPLRGNPIWIRQSFWILCVVNDKEVLFGFLIRKEEKVVRKVQIVYGVLIFR